MNAKRIITRTILATAAVGSIVTGIAVPVATAVAPASGTAAVHVTPDYIGLNG